MATTTSTANGVADTKERPAAVLGRRRWVWLALLIDQANWPYWATLPLAAIMCFVVGYLFGLPALRLEGHYLALATFALAIAVPQILKYKWLEGLTGGVQGIVLSKPEVPFGLPLTEDQWLYYYCLVVLVFLYW